MSRKKSLFPEICRHGRLNASTLVEMLVVMILSSIVLFSLFEGFNLFTRFKNSTRERMSASIRRFDAYRNLGHLFASSDSVKGDVTRIDFFKSGESAATLHTLDSTWTVILPGGQEDTIFRAVSDVQLMFNGDNPQLIDSIRFQDGGIPIRYGVSHDPSQETAKKLRKIAEENLHEN